MAPGPMCYWYRPRIEISMDGASKEDYSTEEMAKQTSEMFIDAFLHNGRLEHFIQVMGYHPLYLDCFLKMQRYLLCDDGPLSFEYRHYIAIMAAARHQCSYLMHIAVEQFRLQGGDEQWLQGLEFAPKKLQNLSKVNKILAHRPWLMTEDCIRELTSNDGIDNWSLSELMHALVLLAHFQSLCSFINGCGITAELDQPEGYTYSEQDGRNGGSTNRSPRTSMNSEGVGEGSVEVVIQKMKQLNQEAPTEMTEDERRQRFEKVETQNAELPGASSSQVSVREDISKYVDDPTYEYQDFCKREAHQLFPTFRIEDYSWEDHGFSLANRLYMDIGTLLDEKFNVIQNLTYNTMGNNTNVNTSSFRVAIWNYIQSIFGIRHDDYDYSEVNHLLERNLKAYIKMAACFPERVTKRDYDSFMVDFKHSEKVHVNLMLLEAKLQAQLLYSLRAITRYMTYT